MKSSAAFLSDKLVLSVADHIKFKSWILFGSQTIVFEGIHLCFEKRESWFLIWENQQIECQPKTSIILQHEGLHQIEISFDRLTSVYLNPGLLILRDTLVIGSDYANDGIIDETFHKKHLTLIREENYVRYRCQAEQVLAVNGKVMKKEGIVYPPALLESGFLKVFISQQYVIFNHCILANFRQEEIKYADIHPFSYQIVKDHYVDSSKVAQNVFNLPEFPVLPAVQHLSLSSMGPMLTMSCASFFTAWLSYQNSNNQTVLILPATMIFSTLFWPIFGTFVSKIKQFMLKRRRKKKYLQECCSLMEMIRKKKEEIACTIIDPMQLSLNQYWQIRPNHPQFLHLPLGYGILYDAVQLKPALNSPDFSEKECFNMQELLRKEGQQMHQVLIDCDLRKARCIAIISAAKMKQEIAVRIILMMGCMNDLKSLNYVLFSDDENVNWHFRATTLFQSAGRCNILDESVSLTECEKRLNDLQGVPVICFVLNQSKYERLSMRVRRNCLSVHFLGHHELIPSDCTCVYRIQSNGTILPGNLDLTLKDKIQTDQRLYQMKRIRPESFVYHRTGMLDYLQLFPGLNKDKILKNWQNEMDPIGVLGIDSHGELIELNLSEHHEGPHGLIAGATGSGKSVLLLGFLLSLAIRCSPENLQMLVIDYKGGSLFQQLQSENCVLPHLCGWLSNQSSFIGRTLASISYECTRRQKLFEKAARLSKKAIVDIHDYRAAQRSHSEIPVLANLLIVVDEFAELKKEEPQFLKTLISLSRIGRSLGLHLILSTQKISGVVDDEITGNTRFTIALRVARTSESRELLGIEDAALLRRAGEFVLMSDQRVVKGQSAYCLASIHHQPMIVSLTDSCGTILKTSRKMNTDVVRQNEMIVQLLKKTADDAKIQSTPLWLAPLRKKNAVPLLKYNQILIGMMDLPETRSQKALVLNPEQHLLLGYQNESQRIELLKYYLKQLLYLGYDSVYFVQLVSKVCPPSVCIQPDKDQMQRFLKKMSCVQKDKTIIVVDDLVEFIEYFESVSEVNSFLFKAIQRGIQCIVLLRTPFSVSGLMLDQFAVKVIFADINDSESMNLFHMRRQTNRITSLSQGYALNHEQICVVQHEYLPDTLEEKSQLKTVPFLPETTVKPVSSHLSLGISFETLKIIELDEQDSLIITGMNRRELKEYASRIDTGHHAIEVLDNAELLDYYTRKALREKTVLWIGKYFHLQTLFLCEPNMKIPKTEKEGVLIRNGTTELLRLFDE